MAVIKALQTYGAFLSDTGSSQNALYFADRVTGGNPWSSSDLSCLSNIHVTDFDVLTLPPIQHVPGH